jgi:DNA (cytosine-5)-methyltransferase 1
MKAEGFTAIDLFAGAGGFSLSATQVGVEMLAAVEYDRDACTTYRNNIKNESCKEISVFEGDIQALNPEDVMTQTDIAPKELDLLLGGPPCQGFSTHRILGAGVDDPRNKLLLRYFDFVKAIRPKVFIVENVPGMLWKRHELYLQRFKNLTRRNGYRLLGPIKINAKDYGVPQNRIRVFMIGVRTDIDSSAIEWPPKQTHFAPGSGLKEWNNASTVFEQAPKLVIKKIDKIVNEGKPLNLVFGRPVLAKSLDPSAIHMNHSENLTERFQQTPVNGGRGDIDFRLKCHEGGYTGHLDTYSRIRLAQPGPTMTTGCTNPSKGRFLHPWKNYGITVRHAARFQTFPENFVFSGGIISQSKQIGNAVPVDLGRTIIETALSSLIQNREQKKHG